MTTKYYDINCANCQTPIRLPESRVKRAKNNYCSQQCHSQGMILKIKWQSNDKGCHLCTSHPSNIHAGGHISIRIKGHVPYNVKLHRYFWELVYGEIPKGLVVLHTCDEPTCINVEHLQLGTQADNIEDMVIKGRQAKGTSKANAKLNDQKVREIRASKLSTRELMNIYAVSQCTILDVKKRKIWKHVD